MTAEKIRELDEKELAVKVKEMEEQLFRLKFQMSMGQMEGLKKYRELKKDRARIYTVQRQRQLKAAGEAK
ncbi:50S ribosomal protein L29 [uncultured Paludibaculum sp.]|uniref:50S ribosomal protein L29 n=1 Tax=uncultured Paludibaculum sp. TaxID=1765020 RepID=UPI002AAB2D4E|nr:50S ribosomal protein L29 [uncultured Paludibaculum sp.]